MKYRRKQRVSSPELERENVLYELTALKTMTREELRNRWKTLFGTEAPAVQRTYLERRLAYRIQELAYGFLPESTKARLDALAGQLERNPKKTLRADNRPLIGTRLIREWQGVMHEITVIADGYEYQGGRYKSLSSVARRITGTRWNGPLFFGLRRSGAGK
jgi:hypothetical protein